MDKSQITQALQGDPRWRVLPNQTRQQLGFEVYECRASDGLLSVRQTMNRKALIPDELWYRIDDQGLPQCCSKPSDDTASQRPVDPRYLNERGWVNEAVIIPEALQDRHAITHVELKQFIRQRTNLSDGAAAAVISRAVEHQLILKQLDDKKHTWYVLNFQQKSLFPAGEADGPIV